MKRIFKNKLKKGEVINRWYYKNEVEIKELEYWQEIKELEYWQEIKERMADLDAENGKVMRLEQAIKYVEKKAKSEGIELW